MNVDCFFAFHSKCGFVFLSFLGFEGGRDHEKRTQISHVSYFFAQYSVGFLSL